MFEAFHDSLILHFLSAGTCAETEVRVLTSPGRKIGRRTGRKTGRRTGRRTGRKIGRRTDGG